MSYLKSISEKSTLLNVFEEFPETAIPLIEYHQVLLRGASPFSQGEREMMAAFVSAINACNYCHGIHKAVAEKFGIASELLDSLVKDVNSSSLDEKLKPVFNYIQKLTQSPAKITASDAEAFYDVGWDDRALHDAVSICALFNFMNRFVEGLGIEADADYFKLSSKRLVNEDYSGLIKYLKKEK